LVEQNIVEHPNSRRLCSSHKKQKIDFDFDFAELPYQLTASAVVKHPTGGVLMVGGDNGNDKELDTLLYLRHASAEWNMLKQKLKIPRRRHVAAMVPDNYVSCS
jgi:hypothetical protein